MTTNNRLDISFGDNSAPEAQPAAVPVFEASLARQGTSGLGFRFNYDIDARRRALQAGLPDIEDQLKDEALTAYWEQLMKWLKAEAEKFDKFFSNPAQNYGLLGIAPEGPAESFKAATAFSNGFKLTNFQVGNDKLTIEPSKITVEADVYSSSTGVHISNFPVEGVLASIALALKNPNFKDKPITLSGDDDLVAFAYAAFKAAGLTVQNAAEIEVKLRENPEYKRGFEAWTTEINKEKFDGALVHFPELKERFDETARAANPEAAAADTTATSPVDEQSATGNTATTLTSALESLPAYTAPEGVKSYEFYNQGLPEKTVEDIVANYSQAGNAPEYNDIRALASVRLFHGEEKQKEAIVGQALFRALATVLKDDTMASKEAFLAHLKSGRIQATDNRAEELAEKLHGPLKAYVDTLPTHTKKIFGTDYPNVKILPDFTTDESAPIRKALIALVECQHNTQNDIREHFVGTGEIVERLLKNARFVNYAADQIAENRLNQEAGNIAKKALGTELKFEITATDVNGTDTDQKSVLDATYEVMQMLIAADRLLSMHPDSVGLVNISNTLKSPDDNIFPLGKDDKFVPFVMREALGSQYAANLARAVFSQEDSFSLAEWKAFKNARVGMAYITAKEGIEILEGLQTESEQIKAGIEAAKTHLVLIIEAAKTINPDVESDFPDANKEQRAMTKGHLITQFEQHYATIGHKVSPSTLGNNIKFLTKYRNNTEATLTAENFAGLTGEYTPTAKPAFKMRLGL